MAKTDYSNPFAAGQPATISSPNAGKVRWIICFLLFYVTTVNYIDRGVIGMVEPKLARLFTWTQADYGNIIVVFQIAYALGLLLAGRFIDWIGVRWGFAIAVAIWSLAEMSHGLLIYLPVNSTWAHAAWIVQLGGLSILGFGVARFVLGFAESANFPACIRAVAEWFPKRQRALATGLLNCGANIGAIATPVLFTYILPALKLNWSAGFYATGLLEFAWIAVWIFFYRSPRNHSMVSPAELAFIESEPDPPSQKVSWAELLRHRQTWAFVVVKFMTDPIWWFWLFWIPDFLHSQYKLNITSFGPAVIVIYSMTTVGSIFGGWLSGFFMRRGMTVNKARKLTMLAMACCVPPVILVEFIPGQKYLWLVVFLIGLAASAHQGFSANIFTVASDVVPRFAVGTLVGLGGMAGAIGGIILAWLVGHILTWTHNNYTIPFVIAGSSYLVAMGIMQLIMPRLAPITLKTANP